MWKWIIVGMLGSSLFLQGCVSNDSQGLKEQEKLKIIRAKLFTGNIPKIEVIGDKGMSCGTSKIFSERMDIYP
ncbi:hypothetical protein [Lederbergia citri]|uniref:Lipoprotein n=1 Tax=Lederbergia citri TaxID=2833580 RepID=A0A942YH60_9BACI|nr:hypothetical protein [Lederbergia citri]MBS4195439.1 hypothetical protein [Lederbergia citri]